MVSLKERVARLVRSSLGPAITAEQEQSVRIALLPDPTRAIDAVLGNLHPCDPENGFTSRVHLADVEGPDAAVIRKVLAAGGTFRLVKPQPYSPDSYYVHSDFYQLLTRLRGTDVSGPSIQLTKGISVAPGEIILDEPTEQDIEAAIGELAAGACDYAILARRDGGDYVQTAALAGTAARPPGFALECRIWLNQQYYEHYEVRYAGVPVPVDADIPLIRAVIFHWYRTGKLPENVAVTNVTSFYRDNAKAASTPASRRLKYWIQGADFASRDFDPVDVEEAERALRDHDWPSALAQMRDLRRSLGWDSGEFCMPGIGFVSEGGDVLHICPHENRAALCCFLSGKSADEVAPEERGTYPSADNVPPEGQARLLRLFFEGQYEQLKTVFEAMAETAAPNSTKVH